MLKSGCPLTFFVLLSNECSTIETFMPAPSSYWRQIEVSLPPQFRFSGLTVARAACCITLSRYSSCADVEFELQSEIHEDHLNSVGTSPVNSHSTSITSITTNTWQPSETLLQHIEAQPWLEHPPTDRVPYNAYAVSCNSTKGDLSFLLVSHEQAAVSGRRGFATTVATSHQPSNYTFLVEYWPAENAASVMVRASPPSCQDKQMNRTMTQYEKLLRHLCHAPVSCIQRDAMTLSAEELKEILSWNRGPLPLVETSVHSLICSPVHGHPEATAVQSWDGTLSYAELDRLSSQLSSYLVKNANVIPGQLLLICFEKSVWTVVAIFAVLKAGAVFVPLDAAYPVQRLRAITSQVGAELILTSKTHAATSATLAQLTIVVDRESFEENRDQHFEPMVVDPYDVAYVMFTSGSTGTPKGVLIEHRQLQLSTFSKSGGSAMGLSTEARVLQFASYAFDACIFETLTTLVFGGCVCIPSEFDRLNNLVHFMNDTRITHAFFTPSVLSTLPVDEVESSRTVIVGVEPVPQQLLQTWSQSKEVVVTYGPTKCCVIYCVQRVKTDIRAYSIGRAVTGKSWVVNTEDSDSLTPISAIGDLLIEGFVLAHGYLRDEKKTAQAFIQDPA